MKYLQWCILLVTTACVTTRNVQPDRQTIEYSVLLPAIKVVETDPIGNLYVADELDRLYKIEA